MSPQAKRTSEFAGNRIPLAIVGLSCMFPQAPDKQSYWRVLRRGEDCITEVPSTHWSVTDLYDGDPASPDRTYAKVGGFLQPYEFDPAEFSMPPNVLEATDTSQILALVGAKEALLDAGYGKGEGLKEVPRDTTSVILGVTGCLELVIPLGARLGHPRWRRALYDAGIDDETSEKIIAQIADSYVGWQENSFPGLLGNVVAGRVANKLDLHGSNCVVDAACASSLAALHLGMMELQSGQADMVISGGVDTFNDIFMFECFSKTPALSHNGAIHPFAADSDGTLLGEGVGVVILKRLSDAERDGDKIYAVIRGLGSSSDGKSGAIYAPDAAGQRLSVQRAYESSEISPATIDLVEAHGTGTKKGDTVEFEGLQSYFGPLKPVKQWCALGTVKSQIGHTKAAAGSASLCKMALALYHKVLLPTINVSQPHPGLHIEDSAFYLNDLARPWLSTPDHPRRGALSSFGFGGSNFHVILEEYASKRLEPAWDGSVLICAASAASRDELVAQLEKRADQMQRDPAYWAKLSCQEFHASEPWRAAAVAAPAELAASVRALAKALREESELPAGCFCSDGQTEVSPVAFLFPGQGSQYVHMGAELAAIFPEVLQAYQSAEALVPAEQRPYAKVFPLPAYDEETAQTQAAALTATQCAQVALGTVEMSQAQLLRRFGVEPQAVAGHSYGELVALHTAGRLTTDELFRLSALRGRLMAAGDGGRGAMLAVSAAEDVATGLAQEVGGLSVANRNSPKQFVLTGPKEAIEKARTLGKARKITVRPLQVSAAFHSSLMASAVQPFAEALQQASFAPGTIPVYANKTGKLYPEDRQEARQLLSEQLVSTVNFIDIVEDMYAQGFRVFVEVGPKAVLGGLVKAIMNGRPYRMLATDTRKGGQELSQLAKCLAELACLGMPVHLDEWEEKRRQPVAKKFPVTMSGANYRKPGYHSPAPWREPKQPAPGYVKRQPQAASSAQSQPHSVAVQDIQPYSAQPHSVTPQGIQSTSVQSHSVAPKGIQLSSAQSHSVAVQGVQPSPAHSYNIAPQGTQPFSAAVPDHTTASSTMNNNNYPQLNVSSPAPGEAMRTLQEGMVALQALQQQTLLAHQQFLATQAQMQHALQTIMWYSQQSLAQGGYGMAMPGMAMPGMTMLGMAMPGMPTPAMPTPTMPMSGMIMPSMPTPAMPMSGMPTPAMAIPGMAVPAISGTPQNPASPAWVAPSVVPAQPARPTQVAPVQPAAPTQAAPTQAVVAQVASAKVNAPLAPAQSGVAVTSTAQTDNLPSPASQASSDVAASVVKIVADKTGFPSEMIDLDQDMESDLGIDSIKRVEILAAIEEQMPGAKTIGPDEIGNLHTLRQVLTRLGVNPEVSAATPVSQADTTVAQAKAPTAQAEAPAADGNIAAELVAVVAEKTGFPPAMIDLDQDMESDLGIDSIKRVEILAAIEEKMPGTQAIGPDEIGNLHTLRQVLDRLGSTQPKASDASPAAIASTVAPQGGAAQVDAPEAPQTPASSDDLTAEIIAVVADKTGFPPQMISLDQDMESDLGIDSIKRVEILAAIEEKMPGAQTIGPDEIGNLRTLRQVVERMRPFELTTPLEGGSAEPEPGAGSSLPPLANLERRVLRYREAAAPDPTGLPGGSGPYLLLDDGSLAPCVQKALDKRGAIALLVKPQQLARLSPHATVGTELSDEESQIKALLPKLTGFISFMPRSANEGWDENYGELIKEHFLSLQAVAPAISQGRTLFATVSRLDGCMGLSGERFNPLEGGLHSLGKVVAQEWPQTVCRAIDIDPSWDDEEAAEALVEELSRPGAPEVGLRPHSRVIPELCPAPFVPYHNREWQAGQVIVVSGGARGVTAECVKTLARYLRPTLVLLGRSPLPQQEDSELASARDEATLKSALFRQATSRGERLTPTQLSAQTKSILANREVRQTLDEVRHWGGQAEYISVDVRDSQAVADVLEAVRSKYGAIHAVIHAAGVLADRKITDKTQAQFSSVFDTKVYGLINLLQATRHDDLRFIAFFSSVSARFGRPGQSDYAIANEVMNKAARLEASLRPHTRVVAIGWGPWDGGMVNDGLRREFAKIGAELIPRDQGALALADELIYGALTENEIIMGTGFDLPSEPDLIGRDYVFPCSGLTLPMLNDHAFGGRAILPLAFIQEYFCQAAARRYPRLSFLGVDNIQVTKPVPVRDGQEVTVTCEAAIVAGNHLQVPVSLRLEDAVYATATVLMAPAPDLNNFQPCPEMPSGRPEFDSVSVYERYLFHGLSFQCIANVDGASEREIAVTADTELPADAELAPCITAPMLSDCALQLGLIWSGWQQSCPSLPLSAEEYRQYTAEFPGQVRLVFRLTERKGMLFQGEVTFCDEERVLARWRGIRWMMDRSLQF